MTSYEWHTLVLQSISIATSFIAILCAIVTIIYTAKNLKEIKKQFFEQNRGSLFFTLQKLMMIFLTGLL